MRRHGGVGHKPSSAPCQYSSVASALPVFPSDPLPFRALYLKGFPSTA